MRNRVMPGCAGIAAEIAAMRQALEGMQQRLDRLEQRDAAPAQAQPRLQWRRRRAAPSDVIHRTQVPGVAQPVLPQRESVADPSTAASRPDSAAGPTDPERASLPFPAPIR
jgi:hypothetical protein